MICASQRASHTVTRERQKSNKQYSTYLWLFWGGGWSRSVCNTACYKTMLLFFTKTLFLSVIYSITDTNNNSPEEMKRKKRNIHHITMLLLRWTESAQCDVVPWTLTSLTKPGFTAVDAFVTKFYDEACMYGVLLWMVWGVLLTQILKIYSL